jgi:hypothetical protein
MRSLQEDDVVLVVPLIGAGTPCIGGSTGGRAAAALEAHRRCGKRVLGWKKTKLKRLRSTSRSQRR